MALPVITPQDFKGSIKIVANQFKADDLQYYIDEFLPKYLRCVLGDATFNEILTQDRQKWIDLLGGAVYTTKENVVRMHNSITESMKKFIYFEYTRDNFTSTQTGKVNASSENSVNHVPQGVAIEAMSRYNSAVSSINESLQCFLDTYEEVEVSYNNVTDNLDGTYTISIDNTKYLETGDSFTLDDVKYTSTNVEENTSIDFVAVTGVAFNEDTVSWTPFESVEFSEMDYSCI